jgi:hypothetical protein
MTFDIVHKHTWIFCFKTMNGDSLYTYRHVNVAKLQYYSHYILIKYTSLSMFIHMNILRYCVHPNEVKTLYLWQEK